MENKKIVSEEQEFQIMMNKQAKIARITLLVTFGLIGVIFVLIGAILLGVDIVDESGFQVGIVFLPAGLIFCLTALLCYFLIPKEKVYNYEKYKRNVLKYGVVNTFQMSAMLSYHNAKIKELETRIQELEHKLNDR